MRNPQYYVSDERPMGVTLLCNIIYLSVRITNNDFLNCAVVMQLYQIQSLLIVTSAPRQQWLPGEISICKILLYIKTALLDSFAETGILSGILYVHHISAKVIDATVQRSQRNSLRYQRRSLRNFNRCTIIPRRVGTFKVSICDWVSILSSFQYKKVELVSCLSYMAFTFYGIQQS